MIAPPAACMIMRAPGRCDAAVNIYVCCGVPAAGGCEIERDRGVGGVRMSSELRSPRRGSQYAVSVAVVVRPVPLVATTVIIFSPSESCGICTPSKRPVCRLAVYHD